MHKIIILTISIFILNFLSIFPTQAQNMGDDSVSVEVVETGHSKIGYEKSIETQNEIITQNEWYATDYQPTDIASNEYTVQLGDTLWEISEAYLGSGIYWTNIMENNLDKIGFLPDGSRALIHPGDILNL